MDLKTVHERTSGYARSISLPEVFRNLKTAKRFAVDIGECIEFCLQNIKYKDSSSIEPGN